MSVNIKLIVVLIAVIALGVWYFLAGVNGWKYPRIRSEFDNDHEKLIYQILKIIVGIGCVIVGIGGIITEFITK